MLSPKFPFDGNQIILTSDRVMLHSKTDGIFLFGKAMVALSSTKTINLDAEEKILLDCNKIELGHRAEERGQPVLLGKVFIDNLMILLGSLQEAGGLMAAVAETNPGGSFTNLSSAGDAIWSATDRLLNILNNTDNPQNPLSKVTFSR